MSNYCFIANYFLTPLQMTIAQELQARGVACHWIVVNRNLRQALIDGGWAEGDVLHLPLPTTSEIEVFTELPIKFNDMVVADRALRHDPERGLAYLNKAAGKIWSFLKDKDIRFVFGESTWAHERLTAAICKITGQATFLFPHTVRFPAGRWAFFSGEDQTDIFEPPSGALAARHEASSTDIKPTPPYYLARNNELLANSRTLKARLARIKRFITRENIDATDPTNIQGRLDTFRIMGMEEFNRVSYGFIERIRVDAQSLDRKFVLYALHKQPESSIDVFGRYYEDQLKLIQAIWRSLPSGWALYVKEHTNAIGDRSFKFYEAIKSLHGVYLVDEKASASELLKACQAVFTVSGTIAYEAALMNRPSFTFAPMFFNRFAPCQRISIDDLRDCRDVRDLLARTNARASQEAADYVMLHSFEGLFTDVYTAPQVLEKENLQKLVQAFLSLNSTGRG